MALNSYLRLTGHTQGQIKGSVTLQNLNLAETIEVYAIYHEVLTPTDASTGLPTGKRQHSPFTIVKAIDRASAPLMTALVQNEAMQSFALELYRPSPSGVEVLYWAIQLTNAKVSSIRTEMLNNKYPENMAHLVYERVTFAYTAIQWTYVDGGLVAADNLMQSGV